MKLDGTYSRQGGLRKYNRPAPAYTPLLGYAFSDELAKTPCV